MKNNILFATIMTLALASCQSEEMFELDQHEIQLTSVVNPMSRGTSLTQQSTQIVSGQEVGVTIVGAKDAHTNVKWKVGEDGALTNTGNPIYWASTEATFYAYHPYNSSWSGINKLESFSVNTDQSTDTGYLNSDLLWATKTGTKTANPVELSFAHKLSKINVTLKSDDIKDLSGAIISICGTNIGVKFNPFTGDLSSASTVATIKAGETTKEAYTASAIIVPQTIIGGTQFIKVTHNEKSFYYKLSADKEFKSGYSYSYTLNVKERQVEVDVESDNITDWTDEDATGDAEEVVEAFLLPDGSSFNYIVGQYLENNSELTKIKFIASSKTTSEYLLATNENGIKGYFVSNDEWLEIHTSASQFITPQNCESMFNASYDNPPPFYKITEIDFGENFNTSNARWMDGMFAGCQSLISLNLNQFNTSNVIDMGWMFCGCTNLKLLDISSFNTSNVTNMVVMFGGCESLTSLDLSHFNTSKISKMSQMFYECKSLTSLNLRNFDTSKVTDMTDTFFFCESLEDLNLKSFDTSKVTCMDQMFLGCHKLHSLDLSNFSFENNPIVRAMLRNVGYNAKNQPIPIKVNEDGHTYLTETTTECGIESYAKFVKPDGTDW